MVFGGVDAVADVDNFGVDVGGGLLGLVVGYVFVEGLEIDILALCWDKHEAGVGARCDAYHGDLLHVGALVAGGLQSVERELGGDVLGGDVAAALSGAATLEKIMREKADVGLDVLGMDCLQGDDGCSGKTAGRGSRTNGL